MKSNFYYSGQSARIAQEIKHYINSLDNVLSSHTSGSPRAAGDALESLVAEVFGTLLAEWSNEYSSDFARRAMADMAFTDVEGFYSIVDVKTHREETRFNMPNLTSVERLSRFYESDTNVFSLFLIKYSVSETKLTVSDCLFVPIEFLSWECLTIGALGWGQIQIANSNNIEIEAQNSRKDWMLQLCEVMLAFYPREIDKITERIQRFTVVRDYWRKKKDTWK
ncbi:MAG: hypothetical protein OXG88_05600 [Gammaproteobacteria bacterium]|nr:hypothetical protein [Gammaproteobacteria bacterium]